MKKILITIGLIISYLTGYSQVFVSDGGGSSNINEAAVGSQISDSLANLAITVNVLFTADTVFAIHNDSLVAIPVTAITTPLQDDIDSINNVVQNIYTLLSGLGYDLVAPSLDSIVLGGQGPSDYIFRLYFNEQLNQDSVPSHLDFTVTENGNAFDLSSSGVSNNMVTVSGATPAYGNNYLLSYAKGDTAIQDTAGNKIANWTGHTVVNRLSDPYVSEYKEILASMDIDPTGDTLIWQNELVSSLIDSGLWAKADVIYCLAQRSYSGALIEWKGQSNFNISDPGNTTPIFTKYEGTTGDGVDDYLSLNWSIATDGVNAQQNSVTLAIYNRLSAIESYNFIIGSRDSYNLRLRPFAGSGWWQAGLNANDATVSYNGATNDIGSAGFFIVTRRAADDVEVYINGVSKGTSTAASFGEPVPDLYIHALSYDGTVSAPLNSQISFVYIGSGLSDSEASDLNAIIERYMDHLGKGVQP